MPHGTPDWGLVGPLSILYGLDDLAEHAVRAGAVSSWDRKGHVIFQDNFKEGIGAWRATVSSADGTICPFTGQALSPPFCARMINGSGGATYARMQHYLGYPYRGRVGMEFSLAFGPGIEYVYFGFNSSLPVERRSFYVRFTPATGDMAYGFFPISWTPFANVGLVGGNIWHWRTLKLVADFGTGFFDKLVFLNVPYDMRALPGHPTGAAPPYFWEVYIDNVSTTAAQYILHLDDVIVTIDEP